MSDILDSRMNQSTLRSPKTFRRTVIHPASNPSTAAPESRKILSVSPADEDHFALERIFDTEATAHAGASWQLSRTATLASAVTTFGQAEFAVVVCERDLGAENWK